MLYNDYMRVAIVGAGASGLMCACMISDAHSVVVFDKNAETGKKLVMTGNRRCNVTNLVEPSEFLESVPQNAQFVASALNKFTPRDTVTFLDRIGIKIHMEQGSRIFPVSGGGATVRQSMQDFAMARGVQFVFDSVVSAVSKISGEFVLELLGSDATYKFDIVIIATGGVSFPVTGSSGDGFAFAASFGHEIVPPRPGLCGLQLEKSAGFQGTVVSCAVEIVDANFVALTKRYNGDMLFTKNGVSGPVIYTLTSQFKQQSIRGNFLQINFVPTIGSEQLEKRFSQLLKENAQKKPFYLVRKFVPQNVANWLVELANLPRTKNCAQLIAAERDRLFLAIKQARVQVKDFEDIANATVTRGGVDVSMVDYETMESKIIPGLFFIGEVLDVDGLCGGFNLQIAFSTAVACAKRINDLSGV